MTKKYPLDDERGTRDEIIRLVDKLEDAILMDVKNIPLTNARRVVEQIRKYSPLSSDESNLFSDLLTYSDIRDDVSDYLPLNVIWRLIDR